MNKNLKLVLCFFIIVNQLMRYNLFSIFLKIYLTKKNNNYIMPLEVVRDYRREKNRHYRRGV